MKKFVQNLAVKITAFLLLIVLSFLLAVSVVAVALLIDNKVYIDDGESLIDGVYESYNNQYLYLVEQKINDMFHNFDTEYYKKALDPEKINFRYTAKCDDRIIDSNIRDGEYTVHTGETVWNMFVPSDASGSVHYYVAEQGENISEYLENFQKSGDKYIQSVDSKEMEDGTEIWQINFLNGTYEDVYVSLYAFEEPTNKDLLPLMLKFADFALSVKDVIFVFIGVALLLWLFLFIILVCGAGHKKGVEGIYLSKINKIPFDLFLGIIAVLFVGVIYLSDYFDSSDIGMIGYIVSATPIYVTLIMSVILSFSARIKTDGILKNTIIYRVIILLKKLLKIVCNLFLKIPLFFKTLIGITVITIIELFFFAMGYGEYIALWIFEKILLIPLAVYIVLCMRRLQKSARKIAGGDTNYITDTKYLIGDFKEHAENLNGISNGMSLAVEKSVKSERMKAELITNVSHDIKTPLTSIINYVDLLKKEGVDSENAGEYLEVLERQSARLKRLTEDLVEASKASTGNISINLQKTNMNVLLNQTAGEYEERLEKNNLSLVLDLTEEELIVDADGRRMWRVFDNLMNNICKYAQPGTRVYLSSKKEYGKAVVSFKNISKEPLNINPDELTERFVRGDKSRNTDGSGLGLSIAKSLTELQGGMFNIQIDGDLFKVTICI